MYHLCEYPDSHIVRSFDIAAISLPIVYNKYGDMIRTVFYTRSGGRRSDRKKSA